MIGFIYSQKILKLATCGNSFPEYPSRAVGRAWQREESFPHPSPLLGQLLEFFFGLFFFRGVLGQTARFGSEGCHFFTVSN